MQQKQNYFERKLISNVQTLHRDNYLTSLGINNKNEWMKFLQYNTLLILSDVHMNI